MDNLIALNEAAELYGVTTQTLRRWANDGKIRMIKPDGHHVYLTREDLNREVPHVGRLLVRIQALETRSEIPVTYALDRAND